MAPRAASSESAREVHDRRARLHGHSIAYKTAGDGPPLLLIHGITSSSQCWERVIPGLARGACVIAPDLAGHGESDKPRGDYSLGAHASTLRDLLTALGHERVTLVGHSLGGGIALQFAYQFPEMCERLVLVDSGGLGREVSFLLRLATLPGSELVLPLLAATRVLQAGARVGGLLKRVGLRPGTDLEQIARGHSTLADAQTRAAFLSTLRSVVEFGGQRVDAADRLYLAEQLPVLLIWGERDSIIPVAHAHTTLEQMPGSRLAVLPRSGHFPQIDEPERFLEVLLGFLESTEPAQNDPGLLRSRLLTGTGAPARPAS